MGQDLTNKENNNDKTLKIEKIQKYKNEKLTYNVIDMLASLVSTVSVLVSAYIIDKGIKGSTNYGQTLTIIYGIVGLLASLGLRVKLNRIVDDINNEYDEAISKLEQEKVK